MLIDFWWTFNHSHSEYCDDILYFMLPLSTNVFLQANEEHCYNSIETAIWTLEVH